MIEQQFLELMLSHGFQPGQIVSNGEYHRFPIKKSDRDGYYALDANGFGVFGNWKTGDQYKFRAGKSEQMTEQERQESAAKYKAELKKKKAEKENAESRAAIEANKIWNEAREAPADHWYLVKKQIKAHEARIDVSGNLLVPIYSNQKIVNLQRILKDGKRFLPDAKKKGCYGKIDGQRDVIFIAEGFATAASINEATGKLCVIALDAGNLLPVAKFVREKFGVSQRIVIAADNDQWTEVKGEKHNTGLIEGERSANEIYAELKYPHFPSDGENFTDWNDCACEFGLEAVRDELLPHKEIEILEPEVSTDVAPYAKPDYDLDDNGRPKCTIENLRKVADQRGIILRYNVIKKQEEIIIPNESYSLDNGLNAAYARIVSFCKQEDMPTSQIGDYLTYLCDQTQYNPVTTWIKSKPWDGHSRLQEFYDTIESPDRAVKELILRRWMTSAVASAFSPDGLATRGVLVFQGEQYLGKTSWFKKLAPHHLDVRKDGYILRLDDKDNIFQCLSHWLIELGELEATFKKSDIAQLKAFIPMDKDIMRRPYARKDSQYGRRTVFFASVNQKEFLFDETGNTRFWSIETTSINYNHNIDMQQLWAEFYILYQNGESYIMSPEEMKRINTNNETFMGPDYHNELAARKFDWEDLEYNEGSWKTATEICHMVGILNPKQSDLNKIAKSIRQHNGDRNKKGAKGVRLLLVPRERSMVQNDY
jgi:putative DNA primase/helicase